MKKIIFLVIFLGSGLSSFTQQAPTGQASSAQPTAAQAAALQTSTSAAAPGNQGRSEVRIKDIARIEGLRGNQLTGIGLVTGLSGQGDSPGNPLLQYVLGSFVNNMGVSLDPGLLKSKNAAVVTVTLALPAFARPGDRLNLEVSSLGDAKNLEGGVLIQTPLKGADGKIYATAQGRIETNQARGATKTQGFVSGGASMEAEVVSKFESGGSYGFVLNNPDFSTAHALGEALKKEFPQAQVQVMDAARITITPEADNQDRVGFLAKAESLTLVPDLEAKVVVNRNTGVVVMGRNVRIAQVAVSVRGTKVTVGTKSSEQFLLKENGTVEDLVTMLQTIGLSTDTVIEVIKSLDRAGALWGELEIIGG